MRFYSSEYREDEYESLRNDQVAARLRLELALLRASIADVLELGGALLHGCFQSGSEPKWTHPSQREDLEKLSDALVSLHELATKDMD